MIDDLKALSQEAADAIDRAESESDLQALKAKYLGRRGGRDGPSSPTCPTFPRRPSGLRPGSEHVKEELEALIAQRQSLLNQRAFQAAEAESPLDVTLPEGRTPGAGFIPSPR